MLNIENGTGVYGDGVSSGVSDPVMGMGGWMNCTRTSQTLHPSIHPIHSI